MLKQLAGLFASDDEEYEDHEYDQLVFTGANSRLRHH